MNSEESPFDNPEESPLDNPLSTSLLQSITCRGDQYFIYTKPLSTIFLDWWQKTTWFSDASDNTTSATQLRDEFLGRQNAKIWQKFHIAAHDPTGKPAVICRQCSHTLAHPKCGKATNNGTSSMNSHTRSTFCQTNGTKESLNIEEDDEGFFKVLYSIF